MKKKDYDATLNRLDMQELKKQFLNGITVNLTVRIRCEKQKLNRVTTGVEQKQEALNILVFLE